MFQNLDDEAWERLEETLIYADVGAHDHGADRRAARDGGRAAASWPAARTSTRRLRELLAETARAGEDTIDLTHEPTVILMVGVNGTRQDHDDRQDRLAPQQELGKSVLLAAGDTFRAAAVEQLAEWAERAGCELVRGERRLRPGRGGLRRDRGGEGARATTW